MKGIFPYLKPYVPRMSVGVLTKFLGTVVELLIPWMLSYILDNIVPLKDTKRVLIWGLYMAICAVLALLMNIYANRVAASVARDTTRAIRHDLFKKISYLSCRQIDEFSIPSLESRLTTDTYNVNQVIGMMQRMGIRAPILLIGGICITMTMEPVLTLVMISVLPLITLVVWLVSRKGIPMYGYLQKGIDMMVRTVRESIAGIRVIKALSKVEQEKEHFAQVNAEVVRRESRAAIRMGITNPMMNLLLNIGLTLVILVGAYRVNEGSTQPGVIIAFLSYFTIILNAMLNVTRMFVMYSRASASAGRIQEVLETPEDMELTDEPKKNEEEHIVFENVSFSYKNKSVKNIDNISFKLKKGETLGIIGATGSGKTTIINLLMRLYEPTSGNIYLNGREIGGYQLSAYRNCFSTVFQDFKVFSLTVGENILMRRTADSDAALLTESLRESGMLDTVSSFPQGFDTQMSREFDDNGVSLSGGQNQKIALSRLYAKNAPIAILDEPSSALDPIAEYELFENMKRICEGRTVIFISHRLSSAISADVIFMMEHGRIIERGNHESLMRQNGKYAEMFRKQAEKYE